MATKRESNEDDAFKVRAARRLTKTQLFLELPATCQWCISGVMANDSQQRFLHLIFKSESKRYANMGKFAKKTYNVDVDDPNAPDEQMPLVVRLAQGSLVQEIMAKSAILLDPEDNDVPLQVKCFRRMFVPSGAATPEGRETIRSLWRCLLPGQAQCWYRMYVMLTLAWPFRLLLLILRSTSWDAATELVIAFLEALVLSPDTATPFEFGPLCNNYTLATKRP